MPTPRHRTASLLCLGNDRPVAPPGIRALAFRAGLYRCCMEAVSITGTRPTQIPRTVYLKKKAQMAVMSVPAPAPRTMIIVAMKRRG